MTTAVRTLRPVRATVVVVEPVPPRPRRRRANRAALAVLLGAAAALGLQAAIGRVVATDRDAFADPMYHDKLARFRARPAVAGAPGVRPLTLLFLGSSRTYDAVDAGAAGASLSHTLGRPVDAFDFATSGAGPATTAVHLRRLLAAGVKPDAVVIEVHPAFLAAQVSPPFETRWLKPLRLRPDEREFVRALGLPVDGAPSDVWLLAGHGYRAHLLERFAPTFSPLQYRLAAGAETDAHGFVRVPDVPERQRERLRAWGRSQYAPCWADYRPGGSGLAGLRASLGTCREAGVRAALLITPESNEFRSWYGPGFAGIAPVVGGLAEEFKVPFFDARGWLPDDLIADGHHLTGAGADAFTARLVRDAVGPWLAVGGAP